MEIRYYQVGGFRPDIRWFEADWQDDKLAEFLASFESPLRLQSPSHENKNTKTKTELVLGQVPGPIELVLGIKPSGTSHLLIPETLTLSLDRFNALYIKYNHNHNYGRGGQGQGYGYGYERNIRPTRYTTLDSYISLSPIHFNSLEDLKKKFGLLRPKAKGSKGKKSLGNEEPWDTSQANKAYRRVGNGDCASNKGLMRGEFEHGRLLYRLLTNQIPNPSVYSIRNDDLKFLHLQQEEKGTGMGLRILSFTCNLRSVDNRHFNDRQKEPKPLDYGLAEAVFLGTNTGFFEHDMKVELGRGNDSVVHLVKAEERLLGTGRIKTGFRYGQTKTIKINEIETLMRSRFQEFQAPSTPLPTSTHTSRPPHTSTSTHIPTILLVHDERLAKAALTELGIDTSNWKSGLGDLLRPGLSTKKLDSNTTSYENKIKVEFEGRKGNYNSNPNPRDPRIRTRDRNRSKSPRRGQGGVGIKPDPDSFSSTFHSHTPRRSSPPPSSSLHQEQQHHIMTSTTSPLPIYVLDVRELYWIMSQNDQDKLLVKIASKLKVIPLDDANSWCAGNEAVYLLKMWYELIKGSAIDEQRVERERSGDNGEGMKSNSSTPAPEFPSLTIVPKNEVEGGGGKDEDEEDGDEDEDFDPNDITQVDNSANVAVNESDDSETDYGSDY